MTVDEQLEFAISRIEAELRPLVTGFHERPIENGRRMRELLNRDRIKFPFAAARIFGDAVDEKGCRYLITILWTQDLLISLFVDITIPQQLCLSMARTAAKVDPHFHHGLSGFLQQGMLESADVPSDVATRILEILSATMEPAAIAPLLRKILLHFDARVRSKATLLIGRGPTGVAAVERLLNDSDPRVRANAVEALWSNTDARVAPIFLAALKDSNNRVLGNAILGLYYAGSSAAISAVFELAKHENPVFRGTAAWVMGKAGDPRFLGALGKLLGESTGKLRSIVFTALLAAKKSTAARSQSAIDVKVIGYSADGMRARIRVTLADASGMHLAPVPSTAFILSVGTEPVPEFSCRAEVSERLAVAFVLPKQGFHAPLEALLSRKPDLEQWSIGQYSPPETGTPELQTSAPAVDPPLPGDEASISREQFSADIQSLALKLAEGTNTQTFADVFSAISTLIKSHLPIVDKRHLIVILHPSSHLDDDAERALTAAALAAKISMHVLSPKPDARMERICGSLSGSFNVVAPESLPGELAILYDSLKNYYGIDFPVKALKKISSDPIQVQVYTTSGSGKCQVARPNCGDGQEDLGKP